MNVSSRKKSYSDLEAIHIPDDSLHTSSPSTGSSSAAVLPPDRTSYWNSKFAIADDRPGGGSDARGDSRGHDRSDATTATNLAPGYPGDQGTASSSSPEDYSQTSTAKVGPPAYYLVDSKGQTRALYAAPTNDTHAAAKDTSPKDGLLLTKVEPADGAGAGAGRTYCGMRRSTFIALMVGLGLLLLGLLVTVLAVTLPRARHGHSGSKAESAAAKMLLPESKLAAMNWSDATGGIYTGVFYQSSNATGSALMAAFRSSADPSWKTVNLSASANPAGLDVLSGTPLAAVNNNGLWNVYYLTSARQVAELYSTTPTSRTGWLQGNLGSSLGTPRVAPGSGLAAMLQSCSNCSNSLLVIWQDGASGQVRMANMTKLVWAMGETISTSASPGTGLGISAFTDFNGNGSSGTDPSAVRIYYADGPNLMEKIQGPLTKFKMGKGNFGNPVTTNLSNNPPPEIASLTYGVKGWTNNIVLTLDKVGGGLKSAIYRGESWAYQEPDMDNSPREVADHKFSAIAATQTMKLFAIAKADGLIHEYQTNMSDPFRWRWQGTVDIGPATHLDP